jgi:hypothetical protein
VVSAVRSDQVMEEDKKRGKIAVLLEALQSRGCTLEDPHCKDEKRRKTVFAVLALALCWADHVGGFCRNFSCVDD